MKIKTMSLVLCGLFAVTTLSGCKDTPSNPSDINQAPTSSSIKSFVDANLNEDEEIEDIEKQNITYNVVDGLPKEYSIVDSRTANKGVIVVKNETNHVGLYSITNHSFLVECQYYQPWLTMYIDENEVGAFFHIQYENENYLIDNHGNELSGGQNPTPYPFPSYYEIEGRVVDNRSYVIIRHDNMETYYTYDGGVAKTIDSVPEVELPEVLPEEDKNHHYQVGDLFIEGNVLELDIFGRPDYYCVCSSTGLTTVFKTGGEFVSSFLIPHINNAYATKDYLYYQKEVLLPEDAITYDYSIENAKYNLDTFGINIMTGVTESIDFDYVMGEVEQYKDSEGFINNALIEMQHITNHHTLDEEKVYLVTPGLKVEGDFSQFEPEAFIKIEDVYYNTHTQILYDENLKAIAYLAAMEPQRMIKHNMFIGTVKGNYGIVDIHGRVVVPFEYEKIIWSENYDHIILQDHEDNVTLLSLTTKKAIATYSERQVRAIDREHGIYAIVGEKTVDFAILDGTHFNIGFTCEEEINYVKRAECIATNDNHVVTVTYRADGEYVDVEFAYNETNMSYTSHGNEVGETELTGQFFEDAIPLQIGDNMIHAYGTNRPDVTGHAYLKLDNPKSGYYNFKFEIANNTSIYSLYLAYVNEETGEEIRRNIYLDEQGGYFLDQAYDYYLYVNFSGYRNFMVTYSGEPTAFTGKLENAPIDSKLTMVKELNVLSHGFYCMETKGTSYQIFSSTNEGIKEYAKSTYNFDVGNLIEFYEGKYFFMIYSHLDGEETHTFKLAPFTNKNIGNVNPQEEFFLKYGQRAVRGFKVNKDGKYVINSTVEAYSIYECDFINDKKTLINHISYSNELDVYNLKQGKDYIISIINQQGDAVCKVSVEELAYKHLQEIELHDQNISVSTHNSHNVFQMNPTSKTYVRFDRSLMVYKYINNGILAQSIVRINGLEVYILEKDCHYVIDAGTAFSSDLGFYIFDENDLPTIDNYHSGDTYFKASAPKSGIYEIKSTCSMKAKLFAKNAQGEYEIQAPAKVVAEHNYYELKENVKYIVYCYDISVGSGSYKPFFKFIANTVAEIPNVEIINQGSFSQTSVPGQYFARERDTYMEIKMLESGTFKFHFDYTHSNNGSYFKVYLNDVQQAKYISSQETTLSLSVKTGDVVKLQLYYTGYGDLVYVDSFTLNSNMVTLNVNNVPSDKTNNATLYCWAWQDGKAGKFYSGIYNQSTNTYSFDVPNDCNKFLLASVQNGKGAPDWTNDSITHQTDDINISSGVYNYDCSTINWKK